MVSFEDTKVAFSHKTNASLRRAYWLFRSIRMPWTVSFAKLFVRPALKLGFPIQGLIKATVFKQFCGGVSIDDCDHDIDLLGRHKVGAILDYSVEGKEKETVFDHTAEQIHATLKKADDHPYIPFGVFKVTGVARFALLEKVSQGIPISKEEQEEFERVKARVDRLCREAYERKVRLFIDAEESWYQQAIDDMVREMMEKYNRDSPVVHNTLQMYRWDRLDLMKEEHEKARKKGYYLGLKLVRGAYMEKEREHAQQSDLPSPIHKTKEDTDRDFDLAQAYCLDHLDRIALCSGTHNEKSCHFLVEQMKQKGIAKNDDRIWFSQLMGMSDNISFNLAAAGYNVAKYVPYGPVKEVFPYLLRRIEENSSVAGQTRRELELISRERARREQEKVNL